MLFLWWSWPYPRFITLLIAPVPSHPLNTAECPSLRVQSNQKCYVCFYLLGWRPFRSAQTELWPIWSHRSRLYCRRWRRLCFASSSSRPWFEHLHLASRQMLQMWWTQSHGSVCANNASFSITIVLTNSTVIALLNRVLTLRLIKAKLATSVNKKDM
jgi:hypothetical protein